MTGIIHIGSQEASTLLHRIRGERFAVLVGSAASIWSGIPPGQHVSRAIARIILNGTDDPDRLLAALIHSTPFEHLMLGYPGSGKLQEIIASTIARAIPNDVHFAIAELLGMVFSGVITTNYDDCIERAAKMHGNAIHTVVTKSDYCLRAGERIDLLKIHGCAQSPSTMVVTLTHEASLPDWKRTALSKMLSSRKLMVIGYSGLDFELCPELERLAEVVWVNLTDEVSRNAKRVLGSADASTILVSDLREVLSQLLVERVVMTDPEPVPLPIVEDLISPLSPHELDLWRVRVLNGIGCGLQAMKIAKRLVKDGTLPMNDNDRYAAVMGYAEAAFHQGLYAIGDQRAKEAVGIAIRLRDESCELRSELERLQAFRAAGRVLRVWVGLVRLRRRFRYTTLVTDLEYETSYLKVVMVLNLCDFMEGTGITLRSLLKWYVRKRLCTIAESTVSAGRWVDFQQAEQIAARFQIPFEVDIYDGPTRPLKSKDGFPHIGYVIGEMMSYRNDATTKPPDLNEGRRLLRIARAIGCQPEVWKLTDVLLHHHPSAISHLDIEEARQALRKCQYQTVLRWWLALRHLRGTPKTCLSNRLISHPERVSKTTNLTEGGHFLE